MDSIFEDVTFNTTLCVHGDGPKAFKVPSELSQRSNTSVNG